MIHPLALASASASARIAGVSVTTSFVCNGDGNRLKGTAGGVTTAWTKLFHQQ